MLLAVGRAFPIDDLGLEHYEHRHVRADAVPARRAAAHRRRAVGDRRSGRSRAPHPPGPLPGRAGRPDGAGRDGRPRLPGAAAGDLHRSGGVVGRPDPRAARSRPGIDAFEKRGRLRDEREGLRDPGDARPRDDRRRPRTRELVGAAMACPDASAAIHECVVAIRAQLTIDVLAETIHAFPSTSRIFNGLFADAGRAPGRCDGPPPLASRSRPRRRSRRARGRAVASAPPGSTGSSSAAAGMTTRSARWPTVSRPRSRLARGRRPDPRRPPGAPLQRQAPRPGRTAAVPAGQRRSSRRTAMREAGPRVERLDRGVGAERDDGAGVRERCPRVAVGLRPGAPQPACLGRVAAEMDRLDAGRDAGRPRTGRGRRGRAAGRARSGA